MLKQAFLPSFIMSKKRCLNYNYLDQILIRKFFLNFFRKNFLFRFQ